MRRRKLDIAGALLLLYVACCHAEGWTEEPFLEPVVKHENVSWRECDLGDKCALVYLKENTEGDVELLRLNTDDKPEMIVNRNLLGLQMANDDNSPKLFLKATQPGDYEGPITQFVASFSDGVGLYYNAFVILENVNDNPPVISPSVAVGSCRFPEEKTGDTGCYFTVKDEDGSACYAEMTVSDDHFKLELQGVQTENCKEARYNLIVVEELDYETFQLHSLEIIAVDKGQVGPNTILQPPLTFEEQIPYVVNVEDIPDEPPVWKQMTPSISIMEKEEHTVIYTAIDGDYGLNWDMKYSLQTDDEHFEITEDTGELKIFPIDRDALKQEIFNLKITAVEVPQEPWEDYDPLSVVADVVVIVSDKNDHEPAFNPPEDYVDNVDEEQPFSKSIRIVEDPDLGTHGTFDLTITPNDYSDNFIVVPATGYQSAALILSALDASLMDYENKDWRTITLEIVAQEHHEETHRNSINVIIHLNNLNDEKPEFGEEIYTVKVFENRPKGFQIVTVYAEDPDEDDWVTYSIRGSLLEINPTSGEVTTWGDLTFDYEKQVEVTVQVYADDQADPPHRAVSEILILVQDLNDEAPIIDVGEDIGAVEEHSEKGTKVSPDISATDPDTDAELKITIDWDGSVGYKRGVPVDKDSFMNALELAEVKKEDTDGTRAWKTHVMVKDAKAFDWEEFEQVRLRIHVEDTKTHKDYLDKKDVYSIIFINVDDINDQRPTFTADSSVVQAVENEQSDRRFLGSVLAVDLDGYPHNIVKYSIEPVFPEGLKAVEAQVVINEDTGEIFTTSTRFDVEEFRELEYEYTILATDGELYDTHKLTVIIQDVNDEVPLYPDEFDENILSQEFEEKKNVSETLVCLGANDNDMTDPYNHITYIIGSYEDDFHMMGDCFVVTNGSNLNREDKDYGPVRNVIVSMRDNFKEGIKLNSNEGETKIIKVTLLDINDNPPKFEEPSVRKVSEKTEAGFLFAVSVTDEDEGENGTIKCDKKPIVDVMYPSNYDKDRVENLFIVETDNETSTCSVICTEKLHGFWGIYTLFLQASDMGTPEPLNSSETYTLQVESENLNTPVITYPKDDTLLVISKYEKDYNIQRLRNISGEEIEDFIAEDKDDPESDNGKVDFTWTWSIEGYFDFIIPIGTQNTIRLQKLITPDTNVGTISGTLTASDRGIPKMTSDKQTFRILLIDPEAVPQFKDNFDEIHFTENVTGMGETQSFRAAEYIGQEGFDEYPIYYHIIDGGDLFRIPDCEKAVVALKAVLDYEETQEHSIIIGATRDNTNCNPNYGNVGANSQLNVIVKVTDINDEPPRFVENPFTGVFRVTDKAGNEVVTLLAIDPDTNDKVSYEYVPKSISADASLSKYATEDAFIVDKSSGVIKQNFALNGGDLSGAFRFEVLAYDTMGKEDEDHLDYSTVFVSVVSTRHQVSFQFYNPPDDVRELEKEVALALSDVLGYKCSIESIVGVSGESAANGAQTDMLTHFIDTSEVGKGAPVDGNDIASMMLNAETYGSLTMAMTELQLSLSSISKPSDPEVESKTLTIVLGAVCGVLLVIAVALSIAFFVRTHTLNQRLDKLRTKKFGSQDSGLNREALAIPGTNVHAQEGSNPVWHHDIDRGLDAISESSGDSELVGIEDSPEFGGSGGNGGFGNPAFQHGTGMDDLPTPYASPPLNDDVGMRRASINPLAAAGAASEEDPYGFSQPLPGGDMDVPRRFSLNPLATGGDFAMDFGDDGDDAEDLASDQEDGGFSNVAYESGDQEPTTEL